MAERQKLRTGGGVKYLAQGRILQSSDNEDCSESRGPQCVTQGWLPKEPIINPTTRVLALGSCFARYFILWLADHGFNKFAERSPYNALVQFGADFEGVGVIAQQFRWAFGEFDAEKATWIDKNRMKFSATEQGRLMVRETLENTDVLIITLGLSEVWYDDAVHEPLWRAVTTGLYDPDRHHFRVETVSSTIDSLETIHRLRSKYLPNAKVVFTISPVRLGATFRPISALTANSVSKAILRAALDEFLRSHQDLLDDSYFYFPSYEIVTDFFRDPYREDNRHLCSYVPARILTHFARAFTTFVPGESSINAESSEDEVVDPELRKVIELSNGSDEADNPYENELAVRISQLETDNAQLQVVCDERLQVIEDLDRIAKARMQVIERLDAECKKYQSPRPAD